MGKSRNSRGILLTSNLPQLQNLIKVSLGRRTIPRRPSYPSQRDPTGYKEEFLAQHNHYLALLRLQSLAPAASTTTGNDKSNDLFADLITFICQVAQCYPEESKELPAQLKGLLQGSNGAGAAKGELRRTVVKNLVMLRNKDVIESIE